MLTVKGRKRTSTEHLAGDEDESQEAAKKPRKPRAYVPALRSGPYAIILALSSLPRDSLQSLTKLEVIELAQPHCNSSFTVSDDPGKFYTAWNSMNTLVDKYLVYERGRPSKRYTLTDEGWELAEKLRAVRENQDGTLDSADVSKKKANRSKTGTPMPDTEPAHHPQKPPNPPKPTQRPMTELNRGFSDLSEGLEDEVPSFLPLPTQSVKQGSTKPSQGSNFAGQGHRLGIEPPRLETMFENGTRSAQDFPEVVDLLSSPERPAPKPKARPVARQMDAPPNNPPCPPRMLPISSVNKELEMDTAIPALEPIRVPTGAFTIYLLLDNREVAQASKRDHIHDSLVKRGVNVIRRSLEIGDFQWIAKVHDSQYLQSRGEEGDEIVLDWIVERKRRDDLVNSVCDGRFKEQKFRLRKSGAKNVVYLVENMNIGDMEKDWTQKIHEALASTQVVNGYFVKHSSGIEESIRYIARLTKMITSVNTSKPLFVIPTKVITEQNYLPLLTHLRTTQPTTNYQITYATFAALSTKSDSLNLRDVYLKMLMCTRGITGPRAIAIQKIWQTPAALIEAFEQCETQKEKDTLVESKFGNTLSNRTKIKGVLSAKVAGVWAVV